MADRKCIKCGCSEVLFDKATGRCVRQGCQCTGCVFPQGSESYAEMQVRVERERIERPVAPTIAEPQPISVPIVEAVTAAQVEAKTTGDAAVDQAINATESPIEPEPTKPTETVN